MSRDHPDPGVPTPGDAPRLAHELLHEAWGVDSAVQDAVRELIALDRRVGAATDRRRAAQFAPAVLLACDALDSQLGELVAIDERADQLVAVLGTPSVGDAREIITARIHVDAVRSIVRTSGVRGRECALVGRVAVERISDFAEAEMHYEQILRELDLRDLAAADERLARLGELEQDLAVRGVTAMLARARRGREELAAGGRGGRPGWAGPGYDDDYTI